MKNILAENMLRFGTKNLTESNLNLLREYKVYGYAKGLNWANSQKSVRSLLDKYYKEQTWPVPVIKCGPYLLEVFNDNNPAPENNRYTGHIYALIPANGVMKITNAQEGETGFFQYKPLEGFTEFTDDTSSLVLNPAGMTDVAIDIAWKQKALTGKTEDLKDMFKQFFDALPGDAKPKIAENLRKYAANPSYRLDLTKRARNFNIIFYKMAATSQTGG